MIDPDGVYDPCLVNDRLLLGLKGTMSEYELSLLRQRGIEARDGKARRGALRFTLPPGYCWSEDGRIEIDPDERVSEAIRMVFSQYRALGSARQLFLWIRQAGIMLPVVQRNSLDLQDHLATACLSHRGADPAQPDLCRRLCLCPPRQSDPCRGRPSAQNQWA